MALEQLRTYRQAGFCEPCNSSQNHTYFEERDIPGGVKLRIKRVCDKCYAKGYKSIDTDGHVVLSGVWRDD